MNRIVWMLLMFAGCASMAQPVPPGKKTVEARLVAFPYPPELFVHVIGEEDRRRVIVSGVNCPDVSRAVRPLWLWIASPVTVEWSDDGLHGRVTLLKGKKETDLAGVLVRRGGCLLDPVK